MHPELAQSCFDADLAALPAELAEMRGWHFLERSYPILDVAFTTHGGSYLRLRMHCENWNAQPPSIELLDESGQHITTAIASSTNIFNNSPHPSTGRSFVCMPGVFEYHTHSSHLNDYWEPRRNLPEFRLPEIVTQIWNGWSKVNK
jgi:hypothetical protein